MEQSLSYTLIKTNKMKKTILLALVAIAFLFTQAQHGGGAHVSSAHVSVSEHVSVTPHESVSTAHSTVTEHSIYEGSHYTPVETLHENEIHSMTCNNQIIYYTLLHNNNTHKMDTIKAGSPDELKCKVEQVNFTKAALIFLGTAVLIGCIMYFVTK